LGCFVNIKYRYRVIFYNIMTERSYSTRIREIRVSKGLKIASFARELRVPRSTLVGWEEGKGVSIDVLPRLRDRFDVNLDWFLTGEGAMFLSETSDSDVIANSEVFLNKDSPHSVVGINNRVTMYPKEAVVPVPEPEEINQRVQAMTVFEIPLLTREQVLHFDPAREIPDPKAHSGDYPNYTLVPMPRRFQDYSTDLRAMVVFNGLMAPLLAPGDVAVFQATGWLGDGVYVYRVNGDLHIGHVRLVKGQYLVANEAKPEAEVAYDTETFGAIGRVRAVVREIG
jgi:transcriptional regulator with XRE-family HTH domain